MSSASVLMDMMVSQSGKDLREFSEMDYQNAEGLMVCGVCHQPLQQRLFIPVEGFGVRVVRIQCQCEKDEAERKAKEQQWQKDQETIATLKRTSLIDSKLRDSTFQTYKVNEMNCEQYGISKRYADRFDQMLEANQGLIFWGDTGTGKSFSAACIANQLMEQKVPVIMTSFVKLIAEVQRFDAGNDEETIIQRMNKAKLLILDDLGAERTTDFALEKVYNVIDSRYRAKMPMIVTTNLTMREMMGTQDMRYKRIFDRLFEVCFPVEFKGMSWRKIEASARYAQMRARLGVSE